MSRTWKIVVAVAVVLVVAVGGGLYWFLRDDSPPRVDIDTAAESVSTTTAPPGGGRTEPVDANGTWTVDTSTGDFDFEKASGTFAGFRIQEELSSIGSTTAVGRTGAVAGTATIVDDTLTAATFEVDLTEITTNQSQRDSRVQSALETSELPTATFTLGAPVPLGEDPASGADISVTATGTLELHGVTRQVEVPIQARMVDGTIVLVGSFDVVFSDYGVAVPSAPIVLSVSDNGTIEMQILLTEQSS
jgi:polyisoprenoid-binding protein YceI